MRFVMVAGEASGDRLGAALISALKARFPEAEFVGVGGAEMEAAGLDAWFGLDAFSVNGFVEPLLKLCATTGGGSVTVIRNATAALSRMSSRTVPES